MTRLHQGDGGASPGSPAPFRRIVLATRNRGKLTELARILAASGMAVTLAGLDEFPGAPEVAETGRTFAANALLKARSAAVYTGLAAVADDSGLCVDALNGMPGVLSARWAGRHGDDKANLDLLLGQLSDVAAADRGAHFACAAAIVVPPEAVGRATSAQPEAAVRATSAQPEAAGRATSAPPSEATEHVVEGRMYGSLALAPRGTNGFGYDPIFLPDSSELTTAEMEPAAKDAISHRGRALRALAPVIAGLLGDG